MRHPLPIADALPIPCERIREGKPRSGGWVRQGFTLVEMIVATVLLAVGVLGALAAFSSSTRAARIADQIQTAGLLGQRKLTEIETQSQFQNSSGSQQGSFDDYPGFRWQSDIQSTPYQYLYRVSVAIQWGEGGDAHERDFVTYMVDTQSEQQNSSSGSSGGTGSSGGG
ncbi:MAG TPA: prepilin-type N-terminal cleavage/methylation domain-containing protein [Chthonomonadaceae bacterium]|nr:prepilin-type N-terminal cleavage/methylation domain-containing protein [Chthonomonadaceae bacterium]